MCQYRLLDVGVPRSSFGEHFRSFVPSGQFCRLDDGVYTLPAKLQPFQHALDFQVGGGVSQQRRAILLLQIVGRQKHIEVQIPFRIAQRCYKPAVLQFGDRYSDVLRWPGKLGDLVGAEYLGYICSLVKHCTVIDTIRIYDSTPVALESFDGEDCIILNQPRSRC